MDPQLCVLFHSKYSPNSKRITEKLRNAPVDITTMYKIQPVCIDNEDIRSRILSSTEIQISYVPCILIIYPNGGVEKYEGDSAFTWVDEKVRRHAPPPPPVIKRPVPAPSPVVEQYEDEVNVPQPRQRRQQRPQPRPSQEQEQNPIPQQPPKRVSPPQQSQKQPAPQLPTSNGTNIDDLNDDDDDDQEWVPQSMKPKMPVRSGAQNYDIVGDFGESIEPNRNITQGVKNRDNNTALDQKRDDLMSAAMAMQKAREQQDDNNPPGGNVLAPMSRP